MPNGYHHLTYAERCQIHGLKASGYSQRAIAHAMNRSPATISRERRRNSGDRGYRHHQQAERQAQERRHGRGS
ncbi:MAG: helix-turn-helix domain-containing protein [Aestuariivita sp.]|nr:helix-turn-helix domain-containing protein [Aestuariivita sp.]